MGGVALLAVMVDEVVQNFGAGIGGDTARSIAGDVVPIDRPAGRTKRMDRALLQWSFVVLDDKPSNSDVGGIGATEGMLPGILAIEDGCLVAAVEYLAGFGRDGDVVDAGREAESGAGGSTVHAALHIGRRGNRQAGARLLGGAAEVPGCLKVSVQLPNPSPSTPSVTVTLAAPGVLGGFSGLRDWYAVPEA